MCRLYQSPTNNEKKPDSFSSSIFVRDRSSLDSSFYIFIMFGQFKDDKRLICYLFDVCEHL